jgi:hypothetical protein
MLAKYSRLSTGQPNPFIDPQGYRDFVQDREVAFKKALREQSVRLADKRGAHFFDRLAQLARRVEGKYVALAGFSQAVNRIWVMTAEKRQALEIKKLRPVLRRTISDFFGNTFS